MKTNIAKTLIESFGLVQEAADPVKVNRFIQLVNSGQMSGELIALQRQLRPEMMSSDALAQAFSKMNGMMGDKIAANKNPQVAQKPGQPTAARPNAAPKAGADPKVLQLQKSLIAKGAKIAADGIMGPQTQTAMKQFGQKPVAQPAPVKTGGAAQAKPAAQAYDDMPPIKPEVNKPLTPQSQTADIMKSITQLKPEQIAHLHNKLKEKEQGLGVTDKRWWSTPLDHKSKLSMFPSAGKVTPELQQLIDVNKNDAVSYIQAMKVQNQKKV